MPTNGNCTIVRTDENGEYFIVGTYPCMWQEVEGYEVKKYGEENAGKVSVWVPDISADVKKHDRIIRGELGDMKRLYALPRSLSEQQKIDELKRIKKQAGY